MKKPFGSRFVVATSARSGKAAIVWVAARVGAPGGATPATPSPAKAEKPEKAKAEKPDARVESLDNDGLSLLVGAPALAASPLAAHAQRVEQSGETLFFYTHRARALLEALQAHPQLRTLHRPANLEDLFLKLTGRQIREDG